MTVLATRVTSWAATVGSEKGDWAAVSSQAGVVVDGAGFPKSLRMGCSHSVTWYAQRLATAFHGWLLEPAVSTRDALGRAIAEVVSQHEDMCDLAAGSPSAAVAGWRVAGDRLEYLVLCDCSVLLRDHTGRSEEITDRRLDKLVEPQVQVRGQEIADAGCDAAELLAVRRAAVEAGRNVPGGFWCCQNEPEAAQHALTGEHALSNLWGAVLATDGATRGLHLLPGTHDLDGLVTRALDGAHTSILGEIRAAEQAAKHTLAARAIKVHDDATLMSLRTT